MKPTLITDIEVILTRPKDHNLIAVKVHTDQGVYGLGCATFQQRPLAVKNVIEEYLKPLLIGRDASNINDLWNMMMVNAYWRNGPVLNNAVSGIDMALWDIKGKLAGMPLYQLLGGKAKDAIDVYYHADGATPEEVEKNVRALMDKGFRHIRCQMGLYGGKAAIPHINKSQTPGAYYDQKAYMRSVVELFTHLRSKLGYEVELLHDIHERLTPNQALQLVKDLEQFKPYFIEDPLPPHQTEWLEMIRHQTSTPIAIGELFNNPMEWRQIVEKRQLDFMRVHISQIGGITPAIKLAHLCENYGVRMAWHGPQDMTPIGHSVNLHLNIALSNSAIQEWDGPNDNIRKAFPGVIEADNGYLYPTDLPGIGVDLDVEFAKTFDLDWGVQEWTQSRTPNGAIHTP
ncbi:enolase C-terminal domain-like protein [Vibrio ulleungensis]|uniref:Starvation-sensing protein RspA n=1 Tax=Vibrio ulleungensis TaxID=2807619 RepID=A0ABS2HCR4_9VIBR|nr:enolase C-terminal domain-like protein [Vibrio ulleungensis]MBM7035383.1 starvation-sensing protein RspA [Vibrio ulleungensis]